MPALNRDFPYVNPVMKKIVVKARHLQLNDVIHISGLSFQVFSLSKDNLSQTIIVELSPSPSPYPANRGQFEETKIFIRPSCDLKVRRWTVVTKEN